MTVKWVKLKLESFFSISHGVLELWRKNLRGAESPPGMDRVKEGGLVARHTAKCGSSVPMDQALEKEYNKLAKGQGGIIGFSRRKEAVTQ